MALRFCGVDAMGALNLALCLMILAVGCVGYAKTKIKTPFNISVAFGLFAVSHAIELSGARHSFALTFMLIRVFAYLIVLLSLWEMSSEK